MKYLIPFLFVLGCNSPSETNSLRKENSKLQTEIDSLKSELYKCNLLIESYEGMPLNI